MIAHLGQSRGGEETYPGGALYLLHRRAERIAVDGELALLVPRGAGADPDEVVGRLVIDEHARPEPRAAKVVGIARREHLDCCSADGFIEVAELADARGPAGSRRFG